MSRIEPVWVCVKCGTVVTDTKWCSEHGPFAKRREPYLSVDRIREIVERVRGDITLRCPPGFSAYTGGEHDASLFERGYDAALDAILAQLPATPPTEGT